MGEEPRPGGTACGRQVGSAVAATQPPHHHLDCHHTGPAAGTQAKTEKPYVWSRRSNTVPSRVRCYMWAQYNDQRIHLSAPEDVFWLQFYTTSNIRERRTFLLFHNTVVDPRISLGPENANECSHILDNISKSPARNRRS